MTSNIHMKLEELALILYKNNIQLVGMSVFQRDYRALILYKNDIQ